MWQSFLKVKFLEGASDYKPTRERSLSIALGVTRASQNQTTLKMREDPHGRNAIPIIQVYEKILTSRQLEETSEDPHRREAIQVHKL